ncbi:hypothetical protein LCGC14_1751220 [marine sediment metagenome]|uniref:Uncharacterized protein n=1 Tax=marine sediment metagenome TaxID=412755 RepID=A0A0F9K374_9ZZZZ
MIKSCEDVKTTDEYSEFSNTLFNTNEMGLRETVQMLCWKDPNIISPQVFGALHYGG